MRPKVTVVIPTFQAGDTVGDAIESVLNQEYKSYELIVVDDGSTDHTQSTLRKYSEKIIVIRKNNTGVSSARNVGIEIARGDFIALLDADDIWKPEKLNLQVPLFKNDAEVGIVYSDIGYFDYKGIYSNTLFQHAMPKQGYVICDLFIQNCVPLSTTVVRKKCFDDVGVFDEQLSTCADYDMLMRIAKKWKIDYVNKPLAFYRFSEDQMHKNWERWLGEKVIAQEKAYNSDDRIKRIKREILTSVYINKYLKLAKVRIREGNPLDAINSLRKYKQLNGITIDFVKVFLFFLRFHTSRLIKYGKY